MKKFFTGILFVLLACGSLFASGKSPLVGDPKEEYYMVTFLSGIDYWKICFDGMEDAAKLYGVKAIYTGQADADVSGQVAVL
ncbi:MAG: hypothetical protein LBQ96_06260, partial [Fusobacteriaceae bacterium]|nr:hypothetical protein [Fusobacteriaceae bacterium]